MTRDRMHFHSEVDTSWVLLEGAISFFYNGEGEENVLQVLERRSAEGSKQAAIALERFAGHDIVVRGSECDETFACIVGGNIVCGAFCGADMLGDGSKVRIVASPIADGLFHAIAIERAKDGLLWLPTYSWRGAHAEATTDSTYDGQLSFWTTLACVAILLVVFGFTTTNPWPHRAVWVLGWIFMMKVGTTVFDFKVKSPAPEHHQGSRIFRMLSYPDPDNLDLSFVRLDPIDQENRWRTVYRYKDGLQIHAGPADEP